MSEAVAPAALVGAMHKTAPLGRRMAAFVYEALLLFGLGLVPGALGALFFAQTGQRNPLQSETALQVFALVFYGIYFVWFWSARGQTLAMQTWRIRLQTGAGRPPSQGRALARYAACCMLWFALPALAAGAAHLRPLASLGLVGAWIACYALLALAEPDRQFWHDRLCGTRLVDARGEPAAATLRQRLR